MPRKKTNTPEEVVETSKISLDEPIETKVTAKVTAEALNVRKEPSLNSEIISVITKNCKLQIVDIEDGNWKKAYLQSGVIGYVMSQYVAI